MPENNNTLTPQTSQLQNTRNIIFASHVDAGKSSLSQRVLFASGKTHKLGEVHDGEAEMDWMPQEQERGITIKSAATNCQWKDTTINLIDSPGHYDFQGDVLTSLRVLDGAVALFDSVAGVEPQSETVWRMMDKYNVPRIAFVNKMDREGANFFNAIETMKVRLGAPAVAAQLPIIVDHDLVGIVDLVTMHAIMYEDESFAGIVRDIPADMIQAAHHARHQLIEVCADWSEELFVAFLEDENNVTPDILRSAMRAATIKQEIIPVFCGSAIKNKGIHPLLDAIANLLPSPIDRGTITGVDGNTRQPNIDEPFAALVFKIQNDKQAGKLAYLRVYSGVLHAGDKIKVMPSGDTERPSRLLQMHANNRTEIKSAQAGDIAVAIGLKDIAVGDTLCSLQDPITLETITFAEPVVHVAIEPVTREDSEKLGIALAKFIDEDPSLRLRTDQETNQTVISGMGELQLEVVIDRMQREFGVQANVGKPQVAYHETIVDKATHIEGRFVKQTGGSGQFGIVYVDVEPNPGKGFEFVSAVKGGSVPTEYIPAVAKGCEDAMSEGVLAGYPMVDIKVTLTDGKEHATDSSEMAFMLAGRLAMKSACKQAHPVILEPLMDVEVTVPEDYVGTAIGDLVKRRGSMGEGEHRPGGIAILHAEVPLTELFGYAHSLKSATQGRGNYSMEFARYERLADHLATELS